MKKKRPPPVGTVVQLALPNGRYAYGRVYRDTGLGIYRKLSDEPDSPPPESVGYMFNVGVFDEVYKPPVCKVVGFRPFLSKEAAWPPPEYVKDVISGGYSIYHRSEMRDATAEECAGLEKAAVWSLHNLMDRIMANLDAFD